ncbi:MAG: hypothetical protein C0433_15540 [Cyclobacterium sp.]|nr:hypothetical protein [Cyclobacterium sp.]
MEALQPIFLWGLLGLSIPVLIHLWNGRRGKVLDWAAMNWLSTEESQSSRSIKLEQLLLLLVRTLLFLVLVLLAVGFWFDYLGKNEGKPVVHLVIPNPSVEAEFRFELEQALTKGEQVYWFTENLPVYEAGVLPDGKAEPTLIQHALDQLPKRLDSLHIYASGLSGEFGNELLYVPEIPVLHSQTLDNRRNSSARIALDSGRFLGVNESGLLQLILDSAEIPVKNPVYSGSVKFRILSENQETQAQFLAALEAIEEVYGLSFSKVEDGELVVLMDQIPESFAKDKLYLISKSVREIFPGNVNVLAHRAGMNWDEVIEKGLLPSLILEPLVDFLGIHPKEARLSNSQLAQRFIKISESKTAILPNSNSILLILFLALFGLERYLAYRNNL